MTITAISQIEHTAHWHISVDRTSRQLVFTNELHDESFCVPIGFALQAENDLPLVNDLATNKDPYLELLDQWEADKRILAIVTEAERMKRINLCSGAFPQPKEGTNNYKLPDGRTISAQFPINRRIDEAALSVTLDAMKAAGVANWDKLVRYKPELAKSEWNTLSDENKLIFSPAVVASPGMPQLEIKPPKKGR